MSERGIVKHSLEGEYSKDETRAALREYFMRRKVRKGKCSASAWIYEGEPGEFDTPAQIVKGLWMSNKSLS